MDPGGAVAQRLLDALRLVQRRPQLIDVSTQDLELAVQDLAQREQLALGNLVRLGRVLADCALQDLGLEDRVGEGLRRTVVKLFGQA